MNIKKERCPKSCDGQLIFIHCLYLVYNTCLFVKTALYVVHNIKCVHLPCFLAFQVFVLLSASLVLFGMESPKGFVRHMLHVLHDIDKREACRRS